MVGVTGDSGERSYKAWNNGWSVVCGKEHSGVGDR